MIEPQRDFDAFQAAEIPDDAGAEPKMVSMYHDEHGGIVCPRCGGKLWRVVWTRQRKGQTIRSKACEHCGRRIQTAETPLTH